MFLQSFLLHSDGSVEGFDALNDMSLLFTESVSHALRLRFPFVLGLLQLCVYGALKLLPLAASRILHWLFNLDIEILNPHYSFLVTLAQ